MRSNKRTGETITAKWGIGVCRGPGARVRAAKLVDDDELSSTGVKTQETHRGAEIRGDKCRTTSQPEFKYAFCRPFMSLFLEPAGSFTPVTLNGLG